MELPNLPPLTRDGKGSYDVVDPFKLFAVHMRKDEATALDIMQGGPVYEDGMRSYAKLGPLFEDPELRKEFENVHLGLEEGNPEMNAMADEAQKVLPKAFEDAPAEHDPLVEAYAKDGEGGDTEIVLLPLNMLVFFSHLNGRLSQNEDGLYQLGGGSSNPFKAAGKFVESVGRGARDIVKNPGNFARTIGAVALGSIIGGPVGALGAAVGHLNEQGHGKKGGLWGALKGATIAKLGQMGLNAMGVQMPSVAGIPGLSHLHGATSQLGQMGSNMAAAAGLQNGGAGGIFDSVRGSLGNMMSPAAGAAGAAGSTAAAGAAKEGAAQAANSTGGSSLLGNPLTWLAAAAGMSYLGGKKHAEHAKEDYERQRRDAEEDRRRMGVYDKWVKPEPMSYRMNPYMMPTSSEMDTGTYGRSGMDFRARKGGGPARLNGENSNMRVTRIASHLIGGNTKGQDDTIKFDVPSGSYIIDASTVSDLGDGSSEAGAHALGEALRHLRTRFKSGGRTMRPSQPTRPVGLLVSSKEYYVDPDDVTAAGGGHNGRGAKVLDEMVKRVRAHKVSNGTGLPPKAKHPLDYMKKVKKG